MITSIGMVSVLGGLAALIALAALAAIVRLMVTDVWGDVWQALERRAGRHLERATGAGAPTTFAAPLGGGRHLAAYHATRRAR